MDQGEFRGPSAAWINADKFTGRFASLINNDLVLGVYIFRSDKTRVEEIRNYLMTYLTNTDPVKEKDKTFLMGRATFAEIVMRGLIQDLLPKNQGQLKTVPVPDSVDKSVAENGKGMAQKGADLLVVKSTVPGSLQMEPVCGIDVTLGHKKTVSEKRRKIGLQLVTATPVITLSLDALAVNFDGNWRKFSHYLDSIARKAVLNGITPTPYYGLDDEVRIIWQRGLRQALIVALDQCQQGILDRGQKTVLPASTINTALGKIEETRKLLTG